ncbi:MAG: DUF1476 domain-containing protein, partial [Phycisphaerales bacterium]|nr:aldolase [Planctomycetaceae bacterium]MDP7519563.1 DUF1476 domain-containing protein [Phycisphaerales bacterium]HJN79807.1 DUF1476 domain-containing protein [Phycisphaerales bacterium]
MSGFSDRERGQEEKFAREQDQTFRIHARRNKLLGLWIADQMGLSGEQADAYALTLIKADMREPGDDDVVQQALADLSENGLPADET